MRVVKTVFLAVIVIFWSGALAAQLRQVAILDIPGRPGFDEMAFANGKLVIAHAGAGTVDIFDPARRRLVARVNNMSQPRGIAVDEAGARVYIANAGNNTITVLSSQDWQVKDNLPVPHSPDALLWVPQAQALYASNWHDRSLSSIHPQTGQVRAMEVDGRPQEMAYDARSQRLYVALQDRGEIGVFTADLKLEKTFKLQGSQPTGMAIDAQNRRLFCSVRYAVLALDLDSGAEVGRVPTGPGVDKLWYDESTRTLYAAAGGGAVSMIRNEGNRYYAEQELTTAVRGHTLAFDAARKLVYVPGGRDGRSKLVILKRIETAPQPTPSAAALR